MRSSILDYVCGIERRFKKKYPKVVVEYTERPSIDISEYKSIRCTNGLKGSDTGSFLRQMLTLSLKIQNDIKYRCL
jgi:hypothetical protein